MSNPSDYTVLVVDDEEELRDLVAFDIEDEGFKVLKAGSGNEALSIVEKSTVHIIVSDIRMPDGDGITMLDKIRVNNPQVPIVLFVTGFAVISDQDAIAKGATAVMRKPIDHDMLIQQINLGMNQIAGK
jgi:CheY-like chemotaxis protein